MSEKEKPHQGGRPIRGNNTYIVSQAGFSGNVSPEAVQALVQEAAGIVHGTVTLTLHVKDGNLIRYVVSRECSFISGKPSTGSQR